jgi:hypothetical protein
MFAAVMTRPIVSRPVATIRARSAGVLGAVLSGLVPGRVLLA